LHFDFFFIDDAENIVDNKFMKANGIYAFIEPWLESKIALYFNFWQLIAKIFGTDSATPFRAFNLIIHFINGLLVYSLSKNILKGMAKEKDILLASMFSAILFVAHPLQVESIVWVSNLRGLLSTCFALLFLNTYLFTKNNSLYKSNVLAFIFYILALVCKPSSVLVFLWAAILEYVFKGRGLKEVAKRISIYPFFLLIVTIVYTRSILNQELLNLSIFQRLSVSINALAINLKNFILPIDLHIIYPHSLFSSFAMFGIIRVLLFLLIIFAAFYFLYKKKPKVFALISGYFIILTVNLGIIPYDFQNLAIISDRYSYFPIVSMALLFSYIIIPFIRYKNLIIALLILLSFISINRVQLWQSNSTLMSHDRSLLLDDRVGSASKWYYKTLLGNSYATDKKYDVASDIFQSMVDFENPSYEAVSYLFRTIRAYGDMKKYLSILPLIQKLEDSPVMPYYSLDLARYFEFIGDYENADIYYRTTEKLRPQFKLPNFRKRAYSEIILDTSFNRVEKYLIKKRERKMYKKLLKVKKEREENKSRSK
jgi:tetratricopeptide (TPR) repeat protein